ncbi:MAG: histidine kinase [Actinomycetaceae bacterium]|nr:histidine kinase [Actinomycetaceae bacterium]
MTSPLTPLDWRSRTRFWIGSIPAADAAWALFFVINALPTLSLMHSYGVQRWYVISFLLDLGIAAAALFRKLHIELSAVITVAFFLGYLVHTLLTPVNLGVTFVLLAAPATVWAVTRWAQSTSWGIVILLLAVAGAMVNPVVISSPILGGFAPSRLAFFGLPAVILTVACYALAQRQRTLSTAHYNELITTALAQRSAISRELHDVIGHGLTAITVTARTALYLDGDIPPSTRDTFTTIADLAEHSLADVRALVEALDAAPSQDLLPEAVADPSAIPGILHRSGITAELPTSFTPTETWPLRYRIALVRCVQEACTNALKHGTGPGKLQVGVDTQGFTLHAENPVAPTVQAATSSLGSGLVGLKRRLLELDPAAALNYQLHDQLFQLDISVHVPDEGSLP